MRSASTSFAILLLLTATVTPAFGQSRGKRESLRRSKRRWVLSTIEMTEEDKPPFPKIATKLFNDKEVNHTLIYSISGHGVTEEPKGVFTIDPKTGVVYVHKPVDRETYPIFHIMFDVHDRTTNKVVDTTLSFDVAIKDINDNAPLFNKQVIDVNIPENTKEGDLPISLSAFDADEPNTVNSTVSMRIVSQIPSHPMIDMKTLPNTNLQQLTLKGCFDYDKVKKYQVLVEAKDQGKPSLSSTATVNINIVDSNTHAPELETSQYEAEVKEMVSNETILRINVKDKDTPNTPASRAKFTIVTGNEEGNFNIQTDPQTNQGVLSVIKGKDYEKTTLTNLQIAVENEEPLFVCGPGGALDPSKIKGPQVINVAVSVTDANDPPQFKKVLNDVQHTEETEPPVELFRPEVTDVDSNVSKIRFEKIVDPENWVTVDKNTGAITTVKRMDHESPYVNNSIYTILVRAIDDGTPPGSATATVRVHLQNINDNLPMLVNHSQVLCGNKHDRVEVKVHDRDAEPFSSPFIFLLHNTERNLKSQWKLDPDTGNSATLVSLKNLTYGNYTVPLTILDQQGKGTNHDLVVHVCDCGGERVCRGLAARSSMLDGKSIIALISGFLLLLLLLLLILFCDCGDKKVSKPLGDEGNQTLVKYNEEGGGAECKAEPMLSMSPTNSFVVTDGPMNGITLLSQEAPGSEAHVNEAMSTLRSQGLGLGSLRQDFPSQSQYYSTQRSIRTNTMRSGRRTFSRSHSLIADKSVMSRIDRRLQMVDEKEQELLEYCPREYTYEGEDSLVGSLDSLSTPDTGDDLSFVQHLGPKFNQLGGICYKVLEKKNIQL